MAQNAQLINKEENLMDDNVNNSSLDQDQQSDMDLASCEDVDNEMPAQIDKHLEFMDVNKGGYLLLGASNLTSRYWSGSVVYFDDPSVAPAIGKCKGGLELSNGVADGVFITEDRAVIGEDGGLVDFISLKCSENATPMMKTTVDEHSSAVIQVKLSCDSNTVLTASTDLSIRLWDCETASTKTVYNPAHPQEITSISPHASHPELFLSSALDGNVLLWDIRCSRPASCVFRDLDDCPTAVCWLNADETSSHFLVGTSSGEIHLRVTDIITHNLFSLQCFERPIFRFTSNPYRRNQIACCADETKVVVLDVVNESLQISYEDDRHTDFARGLVWLEERKLLSCGWDKAIIAHDL